MIISLCIPCMNRTYDLKRAMPYTLVEADSSPPVEICVLDYNSQDDLRELIEFVKETRKISYWHYTGRDHYHIAHAYNLAVKLSVGEYFVIMGADAIIKNGYIEAIRELISKDCIWMRGRHKKGIIACQRKEFINAGGYDERFEFYGGEDKDLEYRLRRRGGKFGLVPDGMVDTIITPNKDKLVNYRVAMSKKEMILHNKAIRDQNNAEGILVANEGREWGKW